MSFSGISKKKKIAVIGAGVAGILSIVSLKDEGLEAVCFEASDRYGGLWNYTEKSVPGCGSLIPTTILNHSKELGAFSNFPPKKKYNNFMRHREFFKYLTEYYDHHDCEKCIRFNTEVLKVRKAEDYADTARLSVTVKEKMSGKVSTDIFDGVMVCTGHFNYPKVERFPGLEKFKGTVTHTHGLKKTDQFSDKNVLVIGTGCSGLDAVEFICAVAKQVYLSARSGMFVFSRLGPNGLPLDYQLFRRYLVFWFHYLPVNLLSFYLETVYIDTKFDHNLYFVKPNYHVLSKDPILNEAINYKLMSGSVIQKSSIKHFTENGVVFAGEENAIEVDAVIMATGYKVNFPFLEDGLLEIENGQIHLYKCMYPTQLPHPSLVFIGYINSFGPGFPLAETQTRWATSIFAGKGNLPSNGFMLKETIQRHEENLLRYTPSPYMSVRVDFVSYNDEIAIQLGCKPNLLKYFFTDFLLFFKLVFGPSVPYQYRLEGPHKWEGAREAIMTCHERLIWPLSREKQSKKGILQLVFEYVGNLVPRNVMFH